MSWYLGICAAALLVGAVLLLMRRARLSLFGSRTTGEVVAYTTRMPSRGERPNHMPHVRFVGPDMREHVLVSRMSANPERWPVGTTVPVAFLERDPERAEIATWARLWAAPVVLLVFAAGVGYAAFAAGWGRGARRAATPGPRPPGALSACGRTRCRPRPSRTRRPRGRRARSSR